MIHLVHLLLTSDGLSEVLLPHYMHIYIYLYTYVHIHTHMSFEFTSWFSRKKLNLLQQQKMIFNSNIHEFSTDFGDTSLCLKML